MSGNTKAGALAPLETAPSMSDALEKWLEQNTLVPRGTNIKLLNSNESADEIIAELAADYDRCGQAGMAFRVRQGFRLLQIKALNEQSFEQVIREREISHAAAQRDMDLVRLFNTLRDLKLLRRAEVLGMARIRELKPHMGIDGLRLLIEGETVDTLAYDAAVKMTHREVVAWRKQRFLAQLELSVKQSGVEVPEVEHAPVKPRALEVATDELLGASRRAQLELDRAKAVVKALLPPGTDAWKAARTELAHSVRLVLHAIIEQAQALDADLHTRFGVASVAPLDGEYRTLPFSRIRETGELVEQQAELNTLQRAVGRQKRLKWRGAPPKTLEAVIAQALHADHE